MRDILTVLAGLLILALTTALAAPPFIDWAAYRPAIDRAVARAAGAEARTEGRIEVRLLPSPRIRVDHLRLGPPDGSGPSLSARFLKAEVALMPLLSGQVRFTETRVGRAEVRVPTGVDGRWRLPEGSGEVRRDWAFEDLLVTQLLVTSQTPSTGRTDQFYAEGVRIEGRSLAGPWRVEGTSAGVPFRLVTGEIQPDRTLAAKLVGGGDATPRFDVDARLDLSAESEARPILQGTAKILFGPPAQAAAAGIPIPVQIQTGFRSGPTAVALDNFTLEAGEGGASLRLTGDGRVELDGLRVALRAEGRRLDVDSFLLSATGQDFLSRLRSWQPPLASPVALDLKLGSVLVAQEEIQDVAFRGELTRGTLRLDRFEAVFPGDARVEASGELGLTVQGNAAGRVSLKARASDRLARYLGKLGVPAPYLTPLDGRSLEASGDLTLALPVASVRNARLALGDAVVTGAGRYTAAEAGARARIDAQVAVQGLDIDDLPPLSGLAGAGRDVDLGLILNAQNVRQGNRPGAGRVAARLQSEGAALRVETLEITDLAGASARLAGRIDPDGSGRVAGRVEAKRAAPLVDLLGSVWLGGSSRLVPFFIREGDLSLDVILERTAPAAPGAEPPGFRTTLRGRAAGGRIDAEVLAGSAGAQNLFARLGTDNAGAWVDRPDLAILRRPANLELRGVRVPSGLFTVTLSGDAAGVRIATTRPFALAAGDEVVDSGEVDLAADDATPLLALLGDGAGVQPPVPLRLRVALGRERDATLVTLQGQVAGDALQGRFTARSRSEIDGTLALDRLSLPWLAAAFALNAPPDPKATAIWSTARFGQTRRLLNGGRAAIRARRLDLGRGLVAEDAILNAEVLPEGVVVRDLAAGLAGGRLQGTVTVTRQGGLAAVVGEGTLREARLADLSGGVPLAARFSATLRFGSSGESVAGLVANLAGGGEARFLDLQAPGADPAGLDRAVARLLKVDDPLAPGRIQSVAAEELARGPLRAVTVTAPATLVGGVVRLSPITADGGGASWQGYVSLDLRTLALDARGTLATRASPERWTGSPPFVNLGYRGPLAAPVREVDAGPLVNGVAALVLQRELERVEAFEQEGNERQRLNQRLGMDRDRRNAEIRRQQDEARRQAEEEAARRAAEEAARRVEEARRRAEEEAARAARLKEQQAQDEAARQLKLRQQAEAERARAAREQLDAAQRGSIAREPPLRSDGGDGSGKPMQIPPELFDPSPMNAPAPSSPAR